MYSDPEQNFRNQFDAQSFIQQSDFHNFFIPQPNAYNDQIYSVILNCKRIINKEKLERTCVGEIETKIALYLSL